MLTQKTSKRYYIFRVTRRNPDKKTGESPLDAMVRSSNYTKHAYANHKGPMRPTTPVVTKLDTLHNWSGGTGRRGTQSLAR
eukprot:1182301-Prorocentrum_minimum.AAC.6